MAGICSSADINWTSSIPRNVAGDQDDHLKLVEADRNVTAPKRAKVKNRRVAHPGSIKHAACRTRTRRSQPPLKTDEPTLNIQIVRLGYWESRSWDCSPNCRSQPRAKGTDDVHQTRWLCLRTVMSIYHPRIMPKRDTNLTSNTTGRACQRGPQRVTTFRRYHL